MHKPGFVALAVKRACTYTTTGGHPYHHICVLPPPVVNLCEVIDDLIEPHRGEIGKLHFHHRFESFQTQTQCGTYDGTFTQWRIPDAPFTIFFYKAFGNFKSASIFSNVLPHQHKIGMLL